LRIQNSTGIVAPNFSTTDDRVCFFSCANIAAFGGVLYETPSAQVHLLQTSIHSRSPESPSPTFLFGTRLQKSQQGVEPKILARQTGKPELLARAGSTGACARLAQSQSAILEARGAALRYKMTWMLRDNFVKSERSTC
jgi:hypothetical protein